MSCMKISLLLVLARIVLLEMTHIAVKHFHRMQQYACLEITYLYISKRLFN